MAFSASRQMSMNFQWINFDWTLDFQTTKQENLKRPQFPNSSKMDLKTILTALQDLVPATTRETFE